MRGRRAEGRGVHFLEIYLTFGIGRGKVKTVEVPNRILTHSQEWSTPKSLGTSLEAVRLKTVFR